MEQTELEQVKEPEETAEQGASNPKLAKFANDFLELLESVLVSIFIILLVFAYFMRPVTVDGMSMFPTLNNGDQLVMYRLFYQPKPGDIVVVSNEEGHVLNADGEAVSSGRALNENLIKRVIAVAGQTVRVDASAGAVYVDDVKLDEPYIAELTFTDDGAFSYPITIPEGYMFVMGDNRNHSTDSRNSLVGIVKTEDALGKAYFRYRPAEPEEGDTWEKGNIGFIG